MSSTRGARNRSLSYDEALDKSRRHDLELTFRRLGKLIGRKRWTTIHQLRELVDTALWSYDRAHPRTAMNPKSKQWRVKR